MYNAKPGNLPDKSKLGYFNALKYKTLWFDTISSYLIWLLTIYELK